MNGRGFSGWQFAELEVQSLDKEDSIIQLISRAFRWQSGCVFWYDQDRQYEKLVPRIRRELRIPVIVVNFREQFLGKITVAELERKGGEALVYFSFERPRPEENFFTDYLYYSLELNTGEDSPILRLAGKELNHRQIMGLRVMTETAVIASPVMNLQIALDDESAGVLSTQHVVYFVDANDNAVSDKAFVLTAGHLKSFANVLTAALNISDWDFEDGEICYLVVEDLLTGFGVRVPYEVVANDVSQFGDVLLDDDNWLM
jgi:hypothetical protein